MRSSRLFLGALGGVAAVALSLTACAPTSSEPSLNDPVTIQWWGWNVPEIEKTIDAFEEEHPAIKVEFTAYSNADYLNNLRTALTSDTGPDVLQLAPGGTVTNYGPLVEDLAPLAEGSWGAEWASNYNELGLTQLANDGRQVALPSYMSAAGYIYYNADILDEVGVTVPTSVDEWKAACQTLDEAGYDCLAHGAKDAWVNLDVYLALANSVSPGKIYEAIDGTAEWTDPDLVTAMEVFGSLFTDGIVPSGATAVSEYPDAFSAFLEKKAAFIALGTWNTPGTMTKTGVAVSQETVSTPIDSTYLAAPFPAAMDGALPTKPFGGPDNGWAISSKSGKKEAAWEFVSFLAGQGGQEIQASIANFPALLDVEVATQDVIAPEQAENILEQQAELKNLVGYRQIPYSDLEAALGQALSSVAGGTATASEALEGVQTASEAINR